MARPNAAKFRHALARSVWDIRCQKFLLPEKWTKICQNLLRPATRQCPSLCQISSLLAKQCIRKILLLHPFNSLFSRMTWVSRNQKGKPFWILPEQEMMGWQWHQLKHMQIICTSLPTDNHASTSPFSFYRPDALLATQPTASKHWKALQFFYTLQYFGARGGPGQSSPTLAMIYSKAPSISLPNFTPFWQPDYETPAAKVCRFQWQCDWQTTEMICLSAYYVATKSWVLVLGLGLPKPITNSQF